MNPLLEYIKNNEDWEESLTKAPYHLKITSDGYFKDLRLFKYNQIKSDMLNPIVQVARGIIVDIKDMKVVCWPFGKFFNYNDPRAHKIDWASAKILEKIDGSIIKIYFYEGRWIIATNGVINAFNTDLPFPGPDNLDSFGDLVQLAAEKQELLYGNVDENYTYIFEITSPYNRVVVPHKDILLTHLGTRNNKTGEEVEVDIKIRKPKEYSVKTFEELVKLSEELPFDDEGYVVRDKNYNRVKVKSLAYLQVHHLTDCGSVSKKRVLQLIISGEDKELLNYYPEYKEVFDEMRVKYEKHKDLVEDIENTTFGLGEGASDKVFALHVAKNTVKLTHPYFFAYRKNKLNVLEKLKNNLTEEKLLTKIFIEEEKY